MSEISDLCQHRWSDILSQFGIEEKVLNKRNQPCPFCGGKDRFRFTDHLGTGAFICNKCGNGDGFELLMRFTGMDFKNVATDIRSMLGDTSARPAQNSDVGKNRKKLQGIWSEAKPLTKGCPTHRYLISRGLAGLDFGKLTGIRCHSGLAYWRVEGDEFINMGKHPAMVGLVTTPEGLPATIHCTYLKPDGSKTDLVPARKVMTPSRSYSGGAIRLQSLATDQVLCVAEGIETALAMKLLFPDLTPWACLDAGNMTKFEPPPECEGGSMYIGADNDLSFVGQQAAYSLAKKMSGKYEVLVLMPKKQDTDFLDEYNEKKQASA